MYQIKPISLGFNVVLPNCMYKVKTDSINAKKLETNEDLTNIKEPLEKTFEILDCKINNLIKSEMENLEVRQDILLEQLKQFKIRLLEIRKRLNIGSSSEKIQKQSKQMESGFKKSLDISEGDLPFDIVINAHPKFIPYGLLGLKNVWKNYVKFNVSIFTHSSLSQIPQDAKLFENKLTSENMAMTKIPSLNIKFIWKDCEHTEMKSCATMYKPIYGEINILRFFSRIGPVNFRYDFAPNANLIDAILDICYQLLRCSGNAQADLIKILSERLGNQQFFNGDDLSIADLAVISSLKRITQSAIKSAPENIKKWYNSVKNILN